MKSTVAITPTFSLAIAAKPLLSIVAKGYQQGVQPDLTQLRKTWIDLLQKFEEQLKIAKVPQATISKANYLLCSLLDEQVLNSEWEGKSQWSQKTLLGFFHSDTWGGDRFFSLLADLRQTPEKSLDLLELMLYCLNLGFMGKYRLPIYPVSELEHIRQDLFTLVSENTSLQKSTVKPVYVKRWHGRWPFRPFIWLLVIVVVVLVVTYLALQFHADKGASQIVTQLQAAQQLLQNGY